MSELRAVLFDMDGTLTDSEKLWTIALQQVAGDLGGTLSDAARRAMIGNDLWESVAKLQTDLGTDRDPQVVARRLTDYTSALFAGPLPWRPGAQHLLTEVRSAGLRTALVTATHRSLVDQAMNTLGRENFDVLVCGDEVRHVKPHPEPYRRALELLDLTPDEALVIEDSPNGSTSALGAGIPLLVVPCELAAEPGPGRVVRDSLVGLDVDQLLEIHQTAGASREVIGLLRG